MADVSGELAPDLVCLADVKPQARKWLAEAAYRRGFQQAVVALDDLLLRLPPGPYATNELMRIAYEVAADMRLSQKPQPLYMHKFMETVSKKLD
jgi:hypothetical protein